MRNLVNTAFIRYMTAPWLVTHYISIHPYLAQVHPHPTPPIYKVQSKTLGIWKATHMMQEWQGASSAEIPERSQLRRHLAAVLQRWQIENLAP